MIQFPLVFQRLASHTDSLPSPGVLVKVGEGALFKGPQSGAVTTREGGQIITSHGLVGEEEREGV